MKSFKRRDFSVNLLSKNIIVACFKTEKEILAKTFGKRRFWANLRAVIPVGFGKFASFSNLEGYRFG